MSRVKRGVVSRRKHKKLLNLTKGFRGTRSKLVKVAKQASLQAGQYAYHGRKLRKRDMRTLWITRISEAVKQDGLSYSVFLGKLKKANIEIDRKIMNDLLVNHPVIFKQIIDKVKSN